MASIKITQKEAEELLEMLKNTLVDEIQFPSAGKSIEFNVEGETKEDIFVINIFKGKINRLKYNIGARVMKNGIVLLELHINPSNRHPNPDGELITGNHWHIYSEKYGLKWAFPADDINSEDFEKNTISFLIKFNVVEKPNIIYQVELI